ncbi:MAG: aminotransferase class I/II-fold pyridoxal phosphate-dependent enzyme [Candidatus Melainabacteria bacterium]
MKSGLNTAWSPCPNASSNPRAKTVNLPHGNLNPSPPTPSPAGGEGVKKPTPLIDALMAYPALGRRRFHMPGHAGWRIPALEGMLADPLRYDLTELDGLDALSHAEGCLLESQQLAAEILGVRDSFYLVNGASVGIQAGLLALLKPGDKVLIPRNAHRSVMGGLILTGAWPVWCWPAYDEATGLFGPLSPQAVNTALAGDPAIRCVVVTSPTYEGVPSDIAALSAVCRTHNATLLVDEAHGSLFPFSDRLPPSACHARIPTDMNAGADVVVQSFHKAGGSLTQSAVASLPHGARVDRARFQAALNTLQTTSPSYLLLASLEAALTYFGSPAGQDRLNLHLDALENMPPPPAPWVWAHPFEGADPMKRLLRLPGCPAETWATWLEREGRLAFEALSRDGALYQFGIGLTAEDLSFFSSRLVTLAGGAAAFAEQTVTPAAPVATLPPTLPVQALSPREAFFAGSEQVDDNAAVGRISADTVVRCPPGIPVVTPGEAISPSLLQSAGHVAAEETLTWLCVK